MTLILVVDRGRLAQGRTCRGRIASPRLRLLEVIRLLLVLIVAIVHLTFPRTAVNHTCKMHCHEDVLLEWCRDDWLVGVEEEVG